VKRSFTLRFLVALSTLTNGQELTQVIAEPRGGFSYRVPADWVRIPNKNRAKDPDTQFDLAGGPNVNGRRAGMITVMAWRETSVALATQKTLALLRSGEGKRAQPKSTPFKTSQGVAGTRLHPAHEAEHNQFLTIYAFKLDDKRALTFICWPSLGDKRDMLNLYDQIMSTVTFDAGAKP
jgi:hypothetical protein